MADMNRKSLLEKEMKDILSEDMSSVIRREQSAFDIMVEPFGESIILFGAGNLGRKVLSSLRHTGIEPLAFADNNPALWKKKVEGLQVFSPQDAAHKFGQRAAFVVTIRHAKYAFTQTREQLQELNCSRIVPIMALYWKFPSMFLPHYYIDLPHKIYENSADVYKAFFIWSDEKSKREYLSQLRYRILLDHDSLSAPVKHKEYFPDDLFTLTSKEIFVDCGAFDGDTVKSYFRHRGDDFNRIIALEPDPANFRKLTEFVSSLDSRIREKLTIRQIAAGSREGKVRFAATGTVESAVSDSGSFEVYSSPLDRLLNDSVPTYIKMDIEGAELDALEGARSLIQKYTPALAVCVYHRPDHMWRIPLYLSSLSEHYHFFLRPHDFEGWDLVCYAVPGNRLRKS